MSYRCSLPKQVENIKYDGPYSLSIVLCGLILGTSFTLQYGGAAECFTADEARSSKVLDCIDYLIKFDRTNVKFQKIYLLSAVKGET
jgi:hypothetical protein